MPNTLCNRGYRCPNCNSYKDEFPYRVESYGPEAYRCPTCGFIGRLIGKVWIVIEEGIGHS